MPRIASFGLFLLFFCSFPSPFALSAWLGLLHGLIGLHQQAVPLLPPLAPLPSRSSLRPLAPVTAPGLRFVRIHAVYWLLMAFYTSLAFMFGCFEAKMHQNAMISLHFIAFISPPATISSPCWPTAGPPPPGSPAWMPRAQSALLAARPRELGRKDREHTLKFT